jgi:hypothetical protein
MKIALGNPDRLQYAAMSGDADRDAAMIKALAPEDGVDVYNDWTPGGSVMPLYLSAAAPTITDSGRVVMSGGATGDVVFPHGTMVHKSLKIMGKMTYSPSTARLIINMVTAGILKIGKKNGAEVATFSLDAAHAAIENAAKNGEWGNYTVVTPHVQ